MNIPGHNNNFKPILAYLIPNLPESLFKREGPLQEGRLPQCCHWTQPVKLCVSVCKLFYSIFERLEWMHAAPWTLTICWSGCVYCGNCAFCSPFTSWHAKSLSNLIYTRSCCRAACTLRSFCWTGKKQNKEPKYIHKQPNLPIHPKLRCESSTY